MEKFTERFTSNDPATIRDSIARGVDWAIERMRQDERAVLLATGAQPSEIDRAMDFYNVELEEWRAETINDLWQQAVRFAAAPNAPSQAVN